MKLESGGSKGGVLIHTSLYSHGQSLEHRLETFSIVITWGDGVELLGVQCSHLMGGGQRHQHPTIHRMTSILWKELSTMSVVLNLRNSGLDF